MPGFCARAMNSDFLWDRASLIFYGSKCESLINEDKALGGTAFLLPSFSTKCGKGVCCGGLSVLS